MVHPVCKTRGFTLFETLIALGVFAFAIVGLLIAIDTSLSTARRVQRENWIREEMESRLARLDAADPRAFRYETPRDKHGVMYLEEMVKEPVYNRNRVALPGFWRARVIARWRVEGQPQQWEASHLIYGGR